MTKKPTNIWINEEDLTKSPEFLKSQEEEFATLAEGVIENPELADKMTANRRDFLKYLGFGLGAATVAACQIPEKKALSYTKRPENIVPGVSNYYASSIVQGGDYCAVLVKTREGRPIKIEGNGLSKVTKGGTSARAQASVLSLYDTYRTKSGGKMEKGELVEMNWADLDAQIKAGLASSSAIRIVSHTQMSPSVNAAIAEFVAKYPSAKVVTYDPISASAQLDAMQDSYGMRAFPNYKFNQAKVVVGIECDFLGTWLSPVEFSADYVANRKVHRMKNAKAEMSRHIQFESRMSLTGSNADNRVLVKPSEQGIAVAKLYNAVAALKGGSSVTVGNYEFAWAKADKAIAKTAKELVAAGPNALVVCGINDKAIQLLVNGINNLLGGNGTTFAFDHVSNQRQGDDKAVAALVNESVDAMIFLHCNPAFDLPGLASTFAKKLESCKLTVSMNATLDETSKLCKFIAPDHHVLESWGDVEPKRGMFSLIQPTINPLFKTRQAGLSFLTWADSANNKGNFYDYVRMIWERDVFATQSTFATPTAFWENCLHDGLYDASVPMASAQNSVDLAAAASSMGRPGDKNAVEVTFYETVNMGNGSYANNPWLQEMPDPVMRTTWDNFISVPIKWDGDNDYTAFNNLKDGDKVDVTVNGQKYSLTVVRQFGQLANTVAIGLGYGRTSAGPCGNLVGQNLYPAIKLENGGFVYWSNDIKVSNKVSTDDMFACVQMHHTYGLKNQYEGKTINVDEQVLGHRGFQGSLTDRSVLYTATVETMNDEIKRVKGKREEAQHLNSKSLYPDYSERYATGHHWGMSIDLSACTGCGACTVACMAENNVPVVGKFEVKRVHEMTWLRIDRYFYGEEETPNTAYMPMMCQHCDNAPCENVCPVNATNHSAEGLNQMTYNRCIGTRYCANNCPYKVRRFNWYDYTAADLFPANEVNMNRLTENEEYYTYMTDNLTRMVLNPDVTVRSRGVIEKCSFCVQRIQEGKLTAKVEGRPLKDGDVKSACQTACPTGAIIFGDQNDKSSKMVELKDSDLAYVTLEEVNVRSNINYLIKVTNRKADFEA